MLKEETLSLQNLQNLMSLVLELWEDCSFDEELENYKSIIDSEEEICYLIKDKEDYIAFVHVSIRNDYVEGSGDLPVAYIEAIYVKPEYRQKRIAKNLIDLAENWAKKKRLKQIASDTEIGNLISINFHLKVGFQEAGRIVCFIKDIKETS
jgi:aminoglycoside 6'-N-acetyltransferase I